MIDPRTVIGKKLKDATILEFIEEHDLKVWYDIDLLNENVSDRYWVEDFSHGLCICFDEHQIATTCFVYLRASGEYEPCPWEIPGLAIKEGKVPELGLPTKTGAHQDKKWVRYDGPDLVVHLECDQAGPRMLTVMSVASAP
jgi:hypothetical protein